MESKLKSPMWPHICVVTCLLVLSLVAPQTWKSVAPVQPAQDLSLSSDSEILVARESVGVGQTSPEPDSQADLEKHPQTATPLTTQDEIEPQEFPAQIVTPPEPITSRVVLALRAQQETFVEEKPAAESVEKMAPELAENLELDLSDSSLSSEDSETNITGDPAPKPESAEPAIAETESPNEGSKPLLEILSTDASLEDTQFVSLDTQTSWEDEDSEWPLPRKLVTKLETLRNQPDCGSWATEVIDHLHRLNHLQRLTASESSNLLDRLEQLTAKTPTSDALEPNLQSSLKSIQRELREKLSIWRAVQKITSNHQIAPQQPENATESLLTSIVRVDLYLRRAGRHQQGWRDYLMLKKLRQSATEEKENSSGTLPGLARRILRRMDSPKMNQAGRSLLTTASFVNLRKQLNQWADLNVNPHDLLSRIEQFERTNSSESAWKLARLCGELSWSNHLETKKLAVRLQKKYRGPNIRFAVSHRLINRLIPSMKPNAENVYDEILGAQVEGRSVTSTKVSIRLLPDGNRWRLGVEADGRVTSQTSAYASGVTFYHDGIAEFHARKMILLSPQGIRVWKAEASAKSSTNVTDLETRYDFIPLFGSVARDIALAQRDEKEYEAKLETEEKIAAKARQRLDEQVHLRIRQAEDRLQSKVVQPLDDLKLQPVVTRLETTANHLLAGYRLASQYQLAASTVPPLSEKDGLLTLQFHQSMVNNVLEQLQLDDRSADLRTLNRELLDVAGFQDREIFEELPENVEIEFSEHQAVHIDCSQGLVTLKINVARLEAGRRSWKNFTIQGDYHPEISGLEAKLVLKGSLKIKGRLSFGDRFALTAIFNKVLSRRHKIHLIPVKIVEDVRLQDLHVTQCVIKNGWISVAIGPIDDEQSRVAQEKVSNDKK